MSFGISDKIKKLFGMTEEVQDMGMSDEAAQAIDETQEQNESLLGRMRGEQSASEAKFSNANLAQFRKTETPQQPQHQYESPTISGVFDRLGSGGVGGGNLTNTNQEGFNASGAKFDKKVYK